MAEMLGLEVLVVSHKMGRLSRRSTPRFPPHFCRHHVCCRPASMEYAADYPSPVTRSVMMDHMASVRRPLCPIPWTQSDGSDIVIQITVGAGISNSTN